MMLAAARQTGKKEKEKQLKSGAKSTLCLVEREKRRTRTE
jgi:hypothetical protein